MITSLFVPMAWTIQLAAGYVEPRQGLSAS